jgi:hypothetical protein
LKIYESRRKLNGANVPANWIQNGDKNTSFFHNYASARGRRNLIKQLKGPSGEFVEGTENIKPVVFNYFSTLFSSDNNMVDPLFLEKVTPRVTMEMNDKLIAPYTAEDVKKAVHSIGDLKAPRPDGLHTLFYKRF